MRENLFHMRVSVRSSQNACVSRRMRETWKVWINDDGGLICCGLMWCDMIGYDMIEEDTIR